MDISRLADLLKNKASSAVEDYSQLANAYPNLKKFAGSLVGNIERNVPTQAELENPDYMQQRALNYMSSMAGAIKAYHGTPHEFDRFDMSKIGTGEGAQAYGHGLYFAEKPEVTEQYSLIEPKELKNPFSQEDYQSLVKLKRAGRIGSLSEKQLNELDDLQARKLAHESEIQNRQPQIYETSIQWPDPAREAADPLGKHHLLDWDKPLIEQPESVQKAIWNIPHEKTGFTYGDIIESINAAPYLKNSKDYFWANPTGSDIYNSLGESMMVGNKAPGQIQASEKLKELGIPGLKYLDQGSRGTGEGSHNIVMFGDEYPQIVNRAGSLAQLLRNDNKNLNAGLIQKYLQEGKLSSEEMAQYEANALAMETPNLQKYNLENANLQGGTPESRAGALGFSIDAYHGTKHPDIKEFLPEGGGDLSKKTLDWYRDKKQNNKPIGYTNFRSGSFFSPKPEYAGNYTGENTGLLYPVKLKTDNPVQFFTESSGKLSLMNQPDKSKTIDAMILNNSLDSNDINEISIIDPIQIRSRFAAFDPLRKASPSLLAGGALGSLLLNEEMNKGK